MYDLYDYDNIDDDIKLLYKDVNKEIAIFIISVFTISIPIILNNL
tara:strand:- start:1716 stop:1850 length:135 start_codon:yes stop_codon:yes gene_type:complete